MRLKCWVWISLMLTLFEASLGLAQDAKPICILSGHADRAGSVVFSSDRRALASGLDIQMIKPKLDAFLSWEACPSTYEDSDFLLYALEEGKLQQEKSLLNRQNGTKPKKNIDHAVNKGEYVLQSEWVVRGSLPPEGRRMAIFLKPNAPESSLPARVYNEAAFVVGAINHQTLGIEPYSSHGLTNSGLYKSDFVAPDHVGSVNYGTTSCTSTNEVKGGFRGADAVHLTLPCSENPSRTSQKLTRILRASDSKRQAGRAWSRIT